MPRIRKKTSNRKSTNDRRKIVTKAREGRKKKAKAAKKNPQWKSKHKKDPGIPNDFPYKDQILAEVAEQRRAAVEEKEKRKEEKRLARQQAKTVNGGEGSEGQDESPPSLKKDLDVGKDAIANLSAKLINPKLMTKEKPPQTQTVDNEGEEEAPILVNRDLPNLKAVLDGSDVLLEVLDARDPLPFRIADLEKTMEGKKILLVLNKIDLCPREALTSWLMFLRREHSTFLFRSATAFLPVALEAGASSQSRGKDKASSPRNDALGSEAILTQLTAWAAEKDGGSLRVAVVGLANAGKSSFLNSLLQKAALPVYSLSASSQGFTTTTLPQEMTIKMEGKSIHFTDTPGLTFSTDLPDGETISSEDLRARDILLRCKGRIDRLKDPSSAIAHIVERAPPEDLMLMYSLPAFPQGDVTTFLSGVARSNHLVKKRGELDLTAASKIVLRDWNMSKFARYTSPPSADGGGKPTPLTEIDERVLCRSKTRKEMRMNGGLVRLRASEIERRAVQFESPWEDEKGDNDRTDVEASQNIEVDEEDGEDESGSDINVNASQDEDDEDSDGQGEGSEKEVELNSPSTFNRKRKRAASFGSAQPAKKITFVIREDQKQNKSVSTTVRKGQKDKVPKSILKKGAATKQMSSRVISSKSTKKTPAKVANVSGSHKNKAIDKDDPNAYDFNNFF